MEVAMAFTRGGKQDRIKLQYLQEVISHADCK